MASKAGNLRCVKLLLAANANPTYRLEGRPTPLDIATNYKIIQYLTKAYLVNYPD
jgi:hypothetical protein